MATFFKRKVHEENIIRYKKILQIADTIFNEITYNQPEDLSISFKYADKYKILTAERTVVDPETEQVISKRDAGQTLRLSGANRLCCKKHPEAARRQKMTALPWIGGRLKNRE